MDTHYKDHAPKNPSYANSCAETRYANNYVTFLMVSPFAKPAPTGTTAKKWLFNKKEKENIHKTVTNDSYTH